MQLSWTQGMGSNLNLPGTETREGLTLEAGKESGQAYEAE